MKVLLKLSFSLILIGVVIWQLGGLGEIGKVMAGIDPLFVFLILVVGTLDRALMTFKWARLLGARGVHLPFLRGMKIYCASMVWGLFLPSTVGADAIRAVSTSRA
ncbi:MAG: lysylphosphatidylglycerol synthase domain-containing protein, partial [Dehalococcoidia bacterium]